MNGKRSAIPSDFSDIELDALRDFLPATTDPELRARIADVLWIRRRHFPSVLTAIAAYLESATTLEAEGKWAVAVGRLERALRLSASVGKSNGTYFSDVVSHICQLLDHEDLRKNPRFGVVEKLMNLVLESGEGDARAYAALTQDLARASEEGENWLQARGY